MTVKTIHFLAIALLAAAVSSCQKDPSTSALHREYLVYTDRDRAADFAAFETFYPVSYTHLTLPTILG